MLFIFFLKQVFVPGCRAHTHAEPCFQMHFEHSCRLHRIAGVPSAAHGHSDMPERTDIKHLH